MARCANCNAEIFIAHHIRSGWPAALDIEPVPNGPIIVMGDGKYYRLRRSDPKVAADVARYTVHAENCPSRFEEKTRDGH